MLRCYNKGCGQEYDPEKNFDDSCRFHPGAPYFHDVYKGWTCCNKKSNDFTEFLNIKGCTTAKHSNVKSVETEKQQQGQTDEQKKQLEEQITTMAPKSEPLERPPITACMKSIKATIAPSLNHPQTPNNTSTNQKYCSTASSDTICKNSGCNCSYSEACDKNSKCQYHSGVPIFHEGMKYWSCCQRKTSDFNAFMDQAGCTFGDHKWSETVEEKKSIKCRYDWYQTAKDVIVSIYTKNYDCLQSHIRVNPIRLQVVLLFPEQNNGCFELDLELRGIIDVDLTEVNMLANKVEIIMPKAEPGWWTKLDFPNETLPLPMPSTIQNITDTAKSKEKLPEEEHNDFNLDDIEVLM